jgi:hypothetical protein
MQPEPAAKEKATRQGGALRTYVLPQLEVEKGVRPLT